MAEIKQEKISPQQLKSRLQKLTIQLKNIKQQHLLHRKNFLTQLAEEYSEKNQTAAHQIIKNLQEREELKRTHRHIRHALGKARNSSLLKLIVPPEHNKTQQSTIHTTKEHIQSHIIDYNIMHYSKAESSPVGIGQPLYHKLGPHGTTDFCDKILHGELTL